MRIRRAGARVGADTLCQLAPEALVAQLEQEELEANIRRMAFECAMSMAEIDKKQDTSRTRARSHVNTWLVSFGHRA